MKQISKQRFSKQIDKENFDSELSFSGAFTVAAEAISLEDASLLRATPLVEVLKWCGYIWGNSKGTEATYNLSHVVTSIDAFISHNWTTSRDAKFFTLAMYFESVWAGAISGLVVIILLLLSGMRLLPIFTHQGIETGILCSILGPPVFLVSLLFGRNIWALIGLPGPMVFVDKICIHQTDKEIQRQGIESLGAFLNHSSKMVAVFTDTYLQKLWTVYELATFLTLDSNKRIDICPPLLSTTVAVGMLLLSVWFALIRILLHYSHSNIRRCCFDGGAAVSLPILGSFIMLLWVGAWVIRKWTRVQAQMAVQIQKFRIKDAACFCEDDRPLVNGVIAAFMRAKGYCNLRAHDELALAAFDNLVHRDVAPALYSNLGRIGFPYRYVLIMCQAELWYACDHLCGLLHARKTMHALSRFILECTGFWLALDPLAIAILAYLSRHNMDLTGWCVICLNFAHAACTTAIYLAIRFLLQWLSNLANESVLWLLVLAAAVFGLLSLTIFIYLSSPTTGMHWALTRKRFLDAHAAEEDIHELCSESSTDMASVSSESASEICDDEQTWCGFSAFADPTRRNLVRLNS